MCTYEFRRCYVTKRRVVRSRFSPALPPSCIYVRLFTRNSQTRVWVDRWIFADVGMMMMQTGMVKGNTAYSSYLDGTPASNFLFRPVHVPYTHTTHSSQFLQEFVNINKHEN